MVGGTPRPGARLRRRILWLSALVVLAFGAAFATAATTIGGNLSIRAHPCDTPGCHNVIFGHVGSPVDACENHRAVAVREVGGGYSTRTRAGSDGKWRTSDVPPGSQPTEIYAVALRKELGPNRVCVRLKTSSITWTPAV